MAIADLFKFGTKTGTNDIEIPEIYPLTIKKDFFVRAEVKRIYKKILTDVAERTHGMSDQQEKTLWDSCLQTDVEFGLISLLAEAMSEKSDIFLVYNKPTNVIRKADSKEEQEIRSDYKKMGSSKIGVFISFRNYERTDLLRIYTYFEYCALDSLNKSMNIAKAVQIKVANLRSSVSLSDSAVAKAQAKEIAEALRRGNDVLVDKDDDIMSAIPDTSATEKSISFLDAKRSDILGLPIAYITGEQTGGIGSSGENDMRAVERGLKHYFVSILKPVIDALFGIDVEFKTTDFRQISSALELLKGFELTSDDYLSRDTKQVIVARAFDVDVNKEKKLIEKGLESEEDTNKDESEEDSEGVKNVTTRGGANNIRS